MKYGSVVFAIGIGVSSVLMTSAPVDAKMFRNLRALEDLAEYALTCASNWGTVARVQVRSAQITESNYVINYSGNYTITTFGRTAPGTFSGTATRVKKRHGFEIHHQALRWAEPQGSGVIHSPSMDACAPPPVIE